MLQYLDTNEPSSRDARNYAHSAILTQAVDGPDDLRPIAYSSDYFSKTAKIVCNKEGNFFVM